MPNRLAQETSPYLLQHANNPVDWYPWGDEALETARRRDVPILLSVGYSSCHWCHVMERESFENPRIAALMNERFVNIKVDREERPDIDSIYMTAVQAMTGHGGWPMTVFATPDGRPFYGGTYFPPEDRGGLPAFDRVLTTIADAYTTRRADIDRSGEQLVDRIRQTFAGDRSPDPLTNSISESAFRTLLGQFDFQTGGFGIQPKFPQPATLEFLLRYHARTGSAQALEMVELTLDAMADGGIHDQIGGGFHRYSTDAFWLVPHFEKMLYDNALLTRLYIHAYQLTGNERFAEVARGIVDYAIREMTSPDGAFYSAQDADSEGVEGKFFVWRPEQLVSILGSERAAVVCDYFGVSAHGNFEGMSILHIPNDDARDVAARHSMNLDDLTTLIADAKSRLLHERATRVPPMTDTKIITAWNGLMLAAVAEAAVALGRNEYLDSARKNANYLLSRMKENGRLRRTDSISVNGARGFLDDYAALIDGLLYLHRADGDTKWLIEANTLAKETVELFWDPIEQQFYDTGSDQETLIVRPRDVTDNALPSGHSMIANALGQLAVITGNDEFRSIAAISLRSVRGIMEQFPTGAGHWLCALDSYLSQSTEVVIITASNTSDATPMLRMLASGFHPDAAVAVRADSDIRGREWPVFQGRNTIDGVASAYVCRNYFCQLPTTNPKEMMALLSQNLR